jgi:phosphohistidine phosphatase
VRRLVFIRHAIAEDRDAFDGPDAQRPLTKQGRSRARAAFAAAFEHLSPTRILTSPFVRATQTAELVQELLPARVPQEECAALRPDADWAAWTSALKELEKAWKPDEVVVIVGHEPSIGALFAGHLGLRAPVPFKKAGIGVVEGDGSLIAFLPPRFLRG